MSFGHVLSVWLCSSEWCLILYVAYFLTNIGAIVFILFRSTITKQAYACIHPCAERLVLLKIEVIGTS